MRARVGLLIYRVLRPQRTVCVRPSNCYLLDCLVLLSFLFVSIVNCANMIICLSGFVIAGTSPSLMSMSSRNDINITERASLVTCGAPSVPGGSYSPHHHQLLQHFAPAHSRGGRCSSSSESVSSHSASPPPRGPPSAAHHGHVFPPRTTRVRTLYACLGESEGELSFEPNQIITNVSPSPEPGWLRGSLNGKSGLVPQNYVEPLP